ncbi:MAG: hypothetical protein Q8Q24_00100 [bacterium]|nr:hypothetical protein [bacterium]
MFKGLKLFILLALLPLFLVFATPVSADIFWSTPYQISTSATDDAAFPSTVTGPNGYLHTTWVEYSTENPDLASIFYSYWNGDTWSSPLKIDQGLGWAELPWITTSGTASSYKVHLVWYEGLPTWENMKVYYKEYSSTTSSWSSPISLMGSLDIPGACAWDPRIISDSVGNLHATFEYQTVCNDTDYGIKLYYTKFDGASWSEPYRLTIKGTEKDNIWAASIAVDSSNNPHVIVPEGGKISGDPQAGIYEFSWNGSTWEMSNKLVSTDPNDLPSTRLVIDGNNNRHLTYNTGSWWNPDTQAYTTSVKYMKYNGSSWSSPITISNVATYSSFANAIFGVTFDSNNNIYVGWGEKVGWAGDTNHGVQVSYKKSTDGVSWSSPIFMRYVYELDNPFLYRDKWDNQHFAWTEQDETTRQWTLWYSTVPTSANVYNPDSNFTLTMNTGDTLSIPINALAVAATISAQIGPLPASANPAYTTLPRSYTFRPHGTTFINNKKATAVINYTDAEIIGADERNMKLYIWDSAANGGLGAWSTTFTTNINRTQNKATITLDHFSLYGMMAPKAEKKVNITWKPPISNADLYSAVDGSTLPIKLSLTYEDGNPVPAPTKAEDITLLISLVSEAENSWSKEYSYGTEADNIRYNSGSNEYILNLHTKELNLPAGKYVAKVYHQNYFWGSKYFQLTEPGKVKGVSTP